MERTDAVLASLMRRLGIQQGVRLYQIRNSWNTLFAEPLSRHMWPASLTEGELLVQVDSPIWIQQLTFLKQDIIGKLRSFGVRDIRFRLGKIYRKDRAPGRAPAARDLSDEEMTFIQDLLAGIPDQDIRDSVKKAVEKSLKSSGPKTSGRRR